MPSSTEFRIDGTSLEVSLVPGASMLVKCGCIAFMSGRLQTRFLGQAGHLDEGSEGRSQKTTEEKIGRPGDDAEDEEDGDEEEPSEDLYIGEVFMPPGRGQARASLTINAPCPGSIVRLSVQEDHPWIIRKSAFLAATPGVQMSECPGIIDNGIEVASLLKLSAKRGSIFVHTFGKARHQEILGDDGGLLSAGLFVGTQMKSDRISVESIPYLFTTSAGVAWPMLRIVGPGQVLMQSHNIESFAHEMEYIAGTGKSESDDEGDSEVDEDEVDEDEVDEDEDEVDEDEDEGEDSDLDNNRN